MYMYYIYGSLFTLKRRDQFGYILEARLTFLTNRIYHEQLNHDVLVSQLYSCRNDFFVTKKEEHAQFRFTSYFFLFPFNFYCFFLSEKAYFFLRSLKKLVTICRISIKLTGIFYMH